MESKKIILSADSTCDLGDELKEKYSVNYFPYHILLGDKTYKDGVDITPVEVFNYYKTHKKLPKTAAVGVGEYIDYFRKWPVNEYDVIHINLSSAMSSSYQSCCIAAKERGNVYTVDSRNLSSALALLIIEAAQMIEKGMSAKEIQTELLKIREKIDASFVVDTLEFLHAGGRCSAVSALGANILKLKPCIEVNTKEGKMEVGKKYRGEIEKVFPQYIKDRLSRLEEIRKDKAFITHSCNDGKADVIYDIVKKMGIFDKVYKTTASCTISSHCGPNTLGILFIRK